MQGNEASVYQGDQKTHSKGKAGQGPGTTKSTPFNPTFPPRSTLPSLPSMFPLQATQPMFHPTGQFQNYNQPVQATAVPQQAPPAPPISVQPQYIPVVQPTTQQFQTQDIGNSGEVLSVEADSQTQFLKTLRGVEKAFRIECTITSGTGTSMNLGKAITQADQGSEMNVISDSIRAQIGAPKKALSDIGFHGLTMRTADHRDTRLDYWTEFTITTSGISRLIRCFIAPRVTIAGSSRSGHFNLLLGLPWLFSINAHISIRESKITIGDPAMEETMRDIIGPEMVFCTEHTLIMYPLKHFQRQKNHVQPPKMTPNHPRMMRTPTRGKTSQNSRMWCQYVFLTGPKHDLKLPGSTNRKKLAEARELHDTHVISGSGSINTSMHGPSTVFPRHEPLPIRPVIRLRILYRRIHSPFLLKSSPSGGTGMTPSMDRGKLQMQRCEPLRIAGIFTSRSGWTKPPVLGTKVPFR